jgi:hypothetical protein
MLVEKPDAQEAVGFGAFVREEEENVVVGMGREAVAIVVAGRGGFALFRFRTAGMLRIRTIGCDLRFSRHIFVDSSCVIFAPGRAGPQVEFPARR